MAFSKAARFNYKNPSDEVPGPGSYNPQNTPDRPWKKGPMGVEKAERFEEPKSRPDTFGLYDDLGNAMKKSKTMHTVTVTSEKARLQMEEYKQKLQANHEKELLKMQVRYQKLEQAKQDSEKDKQELKSLLVQAKNDLRIATSKEAALMTQLERSESKLTRHTSELPALQKKVDELTKSYKNSNEKREAEIERLETRLHGKENLLEEMTSELSIEQEKTRSLQALLLVSSNVVQSSASNLIHPQKDISIEYRLVRLERQLKDRDSLIASLMDYSREREAELELLHDELDDKNEILLFRAHQLESIVRQRVLDSERLEELEMRLLESEVNCEYLSEQLELERRVGSFYIESDTFLRDTLGTDNTYLRSLCSHLEKTLLKTNEEYLNLKTTKIPNLESELRLSESKVEAMEKTVKDQQDENEEMRLANIEAERRAQSCEEKESRIVKEIHALKTENRSFQSLVNQMREGEKYLQEQLEGARVELAEQESLKESQHALMIKYDELMRRHALAESDTKELEALNTELLSHNNQNQKIKHVAKLRNDLNVCKQELAVTEAKLAASQKTVADLEAELMAYKTHSNAISNNPSTKSRSQASQSHNQPSFPTLKIQTFQSDTESLPQAGRAGLKPNAVMTPITRRAAFASCENTAPNWGAGEKSPSAYRVTHSLTGGDLIQPPPRAIQKITSGGTGLDYLPTTPGAKTGYMSLSELR